MGISNLRLLVWVLSLGVLGPLTVTTCLAADLDWNTAWIASATIAVIAWPLIAIGVPRALPASDGRGKLLLIAFVLLGVTASLRTIGTASFMLDATDTRYAVEGDEHFGTTHNCFTCLTVGVHLARNGTPNIYDSKYYRNAAAADRTPIHAEIGKTFSVDGLPYPPPSLLITQVLAAKAQDFFEHRTYWFALCLLVLVTALGCSAAWAGGFRNNRSLLLFPGLLLSSSLVMTLQIGNIQVLVIGFSILGMLALTRKWYGLGGLLLGYAILTKIWPAALLAYLLFGRRWRAVGATLTAMVLLCLASLAAFGAQPFESFLSHQLPLIVSGEAFSFMRTSPHAMLANISVFAWPPKLHALGFGVEHSLLPGTLKWSYTGFLALVVLVVGLRHAKDEARYPLTSVRVWLAILTLAELRSPFLPASYGLLPAMWLLLFLLPGAGAFRAGVTMVCLVAISWQTPFFDEAAPKAFHTWFSLASSAIAFAAASLALLPVIFGRTAIRDLNSAPTEGVQAENIVDLDAL